MYATCLFCQKDLGRNESFETFPVGRRLAFDAAKGRLWVVCSHCERWNLSPLEERWEAIEQAERYYRDSKRRVATDNIGLSKLRDGTTLFRSPPTTSLPRGGTATNSADGAVVSWRSSAPVWAHSAYSSSEASRPASGSAALAG